MNNLVFHASRDYDLDYEIVLDIYRNHKDKFYEKLEEFIKECKE